MYEGRERPNYDNLVMGKIISIIKNLNSINGYIRLIKYIAEKREQMYISEKNKCTQTDINILSSIEKELKWYVSNNVINDEIKRLKIRAPYLLNKYRINNFFN